MAPTNEEIEKDLQHLRHIETCIIPIFVSVIFTGLLLYISEKGAFIREISAIAFWGSILLLIYHIRVIALKDIANRLDALIWDIYFFLGVLILYVASFFTQSIAPSLNINPASGIGILIPISFIIICVFSIHVFISIFIVPPFKRKVFPALCYLCYSGNFNSMFFSKP